MLTITSFFIYLFRMYSTVKLLDFLFSCFLQRLPSNDDLGQTALIMRIYSRDIDRRKTT